MWGYWHNSGVPANRPTPDALTRDALLPENGRLCEALARVERAQRDLRRDRDRLQRERDRLTEPLDAARRAGYRQAAPCAKTRRRGTGRRPGRRAGAA